MTLVHPKNMFISNISMYAWLQFSVVFLHIFHLCFGVISSSLACINVVMCFCTLVMLGDTSLSNQALAGIFLPCSVI